MNTTDLSTDLSRPSRTYRGNSPEERKSQRRAKLIAAAKELYGSNGFHATKVKMICVTAGLTERYFYENFANSEELFIAMHTETSTQIIARLKQAATRQEGSQAQVYAILDTYYADIAADPVTARLFAVDAGYISRVAREVCSAWRLSFGQLLTETMKVPEAPGMLRHGVVIGLLGIGVHWMESGFASPKSEIVETALALVTPLNPAVCADSVAPTSP
ncbi:TetR/AcrR family transcriptional regulator [Pseudomonas benzopyrenica]|uniref:TetR/AcrR family transcriptional regulator n=1 Tax=Pseudomonas benzopyrenica TaxID=2993566 RepID=A0ABZ2FYN3_9PSED|nr:TetR/AcrR family transcriptional regulator [Pseudomonas oryzihabitans]